MSIYSGFATRFQEESYDHCIDALLYVLQKRIIKFYVGEQAEEEKFISVVTRLHHQMQKMEKSKYLDPKSSESVKELVHFMKVYQGNIIGNARQVQSMQQKTVNRKDTESLSGATQQPPQVKKVSYWVEKGARGQENQEQVEKEIESIEPSSNDRPTQSSRQKSGGAEFKRTKHHNRSIRGVHMKNTSKMNKSREKDQQNNSSSHLGTNKITKIRATSNYLRDKPPIFPQKTAEGCINDSSSRMSRRFSNNPSYGLVPGQLKPAASKDQVADIIKEYMLKSKKNKKLGNFSRENTDYMSKLNDF